jgi:hypothetical protein
MRPADKLRFLNRIFPVAVIVVFFWALLLRAPEIISGNYLFGFDHGRDYLAAYNIAVNHKLTLIGAEVGAGSAGLTGLFHGPGYFYFVALMYLLFRGDPYGGLVLMFFFGMATLVLVYLTAKQMFGKKAALTALFLTGISPLLAPQSRFLWNHHPSSFFIVIVLYLVYQIRCNPRLFAPLAVFVAGFIYHFELAIAVPLVFAIWFAAIAVYRIRDWKTYLMLIGATLASFLPMLLFEMRHGFMAVKGLFAYVFSGRGEAAGIPLARLSGHFGNYLSSARNSFPIESGLLPDWSYTGLCLALLIVLIILALKASDRKLRRFAGFLLLTAAVTYAMFLLLDNTVWDYYLIHLHFVYIYIFAVCFAWSIGHWRKNLLAKAVFVVLAFYLLSFVRASFYRIKLNWRVDYPDYGGVEKIRGKRAALDYVYSQAAGQPFNAFVFMAPIYTYPYDYLFKTYGREKYGYEPGNQKSGDVYLIIERDSQNWYRGWLETVIKGGEVVSSEVIPAGQLIEHRYFEENKL